MPPNSLADYLCPLPSIATSTEHLQVAEVICSASRDGHDVIDLNWGLFGGPPAVLTGSSLHAIQRASDPVRDGLTPHDYFGFRVCRRPCDAGLELRRRDLPACPA